MHGKGLYKLQVGWGRYYGAYRVASAMHKNIVYTFTHAICKVTPKLTDVPSEGHGACRRRSAVHDTLPHNEGRGWAVRDQEVHIVQGTIVVHLELNNTQDDRCSARSSLAQQR